MTDLLKQAFDEASDLPDQEQNLLAAWLMEELRSEREWDRRFAESQSQLERLANAALREHEAGTTHPPDPNQL